MRECPVCTGGPTWRKEIFRMSYRIPDGWPLPSEIVWYTCNRCGMIYGDGDMTQAMFDQYYRERYGYGINNPQNTERLKMDAFMIYNTVKSDAVIVDFGGSGDDGRSVIIEHLQSADYNNAMCVNAGDLVPECDVLYASHVLEHIYDLPQTMKRIAAALKPDGLLIVDVPDATGLLERWKMPILDFNTKHLNHFTLRNLLDLGHKWGFEAVFVKPYELEYAPCFQVHFKRRNVAEHSFFHINENIEHRKKKLQAIDYPVNIWGMSDIVWHLLSMVDLGVLNYIDNDPAYRGQTYNGKSVLEKPDNDVPIVIMAQGQRGRLIENIRKAGVTNQIIEI